MLITEVASAQAARLCNAFYHSPIGWLKITGDDAAISGVQFLDEATEPSSQRSLIVEQCIEQLHDYFRGSRQQFDLPLRLHGTTFQKLVWQKLLEIPYGNTASYRDIACRLGKPRAVRAVGHANGQNPIAIIIPCHRVIGANGHLIGYGGGLWRKQWLLLHERNMLL